MPDFTGLPAMPAMVWRAPQDHGDEMRYADMPGAQCETFVAAATSAVWEIAIDIQAPARWSRELHRTEWLDGAMAPALGARFAGRNQHPVIGAWRTVSQIIELDPERAFAWCVLDADGRFGKATLSLAEPMATWRFTLTPDAGGTLLRQTVRIGPGRSGLSAAIDRMPDKEEYLVALRLGELREGMHATLNGIKAAAEQRTD
ncbi:SRPBCC family protein [Streptomyces sp. NPDC087849]|uniref:SRPBCC family protein n=1 Tax=Streptomyces sp. NPDC087849 TaxID=3365808 RepID=UPI003805C805